jgi:hypothetical protein
MRRLGVALLLLAAAPALAGAVEAYRQGPGDCPRDRPADARRITAAEDAEWALDTWRVYALQYRLDDGQKNHRGREHSYVILDPVGNCIANIPGT